MMNVAVVGASGQLGTDVVRVLWKAGGYAVSPLTHEQIDVSDDASVRAALDRVRPNAVVNCAAFHRVDECEAQPAEALRVNALGALNIARACAAAGALCVHISTDYVFGGHGRGPYSEEHLPSPVNVYGVSKLAGEHLVAQACPRWLVVRVASLFGTAPARAKQGNFVETILAKAALGQPIRVVDDMRMSPTYAYDAARALEHLIRHGAHGIVHLSNAGACTWYEFASKIVALAALRARVVSISSAEYPTRARRPADCSLFSVRATDAVRRCLRPWDEALRAYLLARGTIAEPGSTVTSRRRRRADSQTIARIVRTKEGKPIGLRK